jgi:DNA polymerase-3 subunit alpha
MNLFADAGADGSGVSVFEERVAIPDDEYGKDQRLLFEKEMLGLYVSDHPLLGAQRSLRSKVECSIAELRETRAGGVEPARDEGAPRTVGGLVTSLSRRYTRKGDLMATFVLEDLSSAIEVMVFPRTMSDYGHLLEDDAIVCIRGRLDTRDDEPKLVAMDVSRPEIRHDEDVPPFRVQVGLSKLDDGRVEQLKSILVAHPGERMVFVHLVANARTTVVQLADEFVVDGSASLCAELCELLGPDCVL